MQATLIDGKAIAAEIRDEVRLQTTALRESTGIVPGLAFLLVGDNAASRTYVASKERACAHCGFQSTTVVLPGDAAQAEILSQIERWNTDPEMHGILVQLPLPPHISEDSVIEAIAPRKDVDGFHPINVGKLLIGQEGFIPCTPAGIHELLLRSGIETSGKHVVVVGRSNIVGKPIAMLLSRKAAGANAVVTITHSAAGDISRYTRDADILIAAIGRANTITANMLREGVVVIDVGINRVDDASSEKGYRIVGDVDFEGVARKAAAITPVPGGVGPMTIALLMRNTLQAAQRAANSP